MVIYKDGSYHVRLKVLDCPISPNFNLNNFVSGSPVRDCEYKLTTGWRQEFNF
jgi:hypothetical protein